MKTLPPAHTLYFMLKEAKALLLGEVRLWFC